MIEEDDEFRVLRVLRERRRAFYLADTKAKTESVGCEVSSVCFCLSAFSKNV